MNGSERWVAVSAFGAAMFAIGFSFAGVACNRRDVSVSDAVRGMDSVAAPAPAASLGSVARVVNSAPPVAPNALVASAAGASENAAPELKAASEGLKLKRIVVAHKIENREPVGSDEFTLGSAPVFAFVEFENSSRDARNVRVMFQNQDSKATVGHVKLTVPGTAERFRTWGNTRLIKDPGHWVAVVSTIDGVELGRAPFEVKG